METYGDLITNGLDLVSFLLVTPEIVRLLAPAVSELIGLVIASLLAAGMMVLPAIGIYYYWVGPKTVWWLFLAIFLLIAIVFWLGEYVLSLLAALIDLLTEHFEKVWRGKPWMKLLLALVGHIFAAVTREGAARSVGAEVHQLARRASKHLLAIGIILFLVSRLIALYGSALKAGLWAS